MMKKTLLLGVILFLSSVSLLNAQQTDSTDVKTMDPKAATFYNNGIKLMIAGKYSEAAATFDSSLQVAKDFKTYFQKGVALQKAGNNDEARKAYLASLAIDSTYDKAYLNLANLSLGEKKYAEAINMYKKVQRVSKDQKIKDEAEQSIALANDNIAIEYFNKGNELSKANNFDEAIQNYDKSLAISKDYKTYYQKGITLSKMEKPKEAMEAFNASIAANKDFDQAYIALASVMTSEKDYDGAVKNFQQAAAVTQNEKIKAAANEGIIKIYMIAGNAALKEKKYDKALESFKKANEASENDQAYLGIAKAQIEKKQYNDALAALDKAGEIKKTVTDGAIAYYKGVLYLNKGDEKKAIEFFTQVGNDPVYKKPAKSQVDYLKAKEAQAKPKK